MKPSFLKGHHCVRRDAFGRRRRCPAGVFRRDFPPLQQKWECSSVREKWSEVNRKRLEYTVVITPAFGYPRRDGGAGVETEEGEGEGEA